MKDRVVLYHADCPDGFTSAYVAWTVFGDSADYVPVRYGEPPPDVTAQHVLIVDFSYPRETLIDMAAKSKSIRVLDHHASAERDLAGLDFCTFDNNECGATLTWKALRGDDEPMLLSLVKDRDLWKWELDDSKALNAWIGVQERSFDRWDKMVDELHSEPDICALSGHAVIKHIDAYVEATSKNARRSDVFLSGEHAVWSDIPVVNAPGMMASELIGKLAETAYFAIGWHQIEDGRFKYSLRSRGKDGADVSRIAEAFGGSGHRNAAGFVSAKPPWELFEKEEQS